MSYRPSLYPSHSSSSSPTSPGVQRLLDKQREYEAFHAIFAHTQGLAQLFGAFSDKYDVLDGGSEAVGDVVEHWQNVFRVTGLALGPCALPPSLPPSLLSPPSSPQPDSHRTDLNPPSPRTIASLADQRSALTTSPDEDPSNVLLPPGTLPAKLVRIPVKQDEVPPAREGPGTEAGSPGEGQ
ncbi:SPOSA6832_01382 [Sporobolomyces salmonicolor]|uniref:SPOSA6832_01382-mRNA-1:cds n=1 Tax=Sporidiobolus salmonicolor TaxID=5005 RepID=A0A0D6EIM0_SPOSA|nr:SPOSA6832_01382 [Sporobolomyces salmonicolor]